LLKIPTKSWAMSGKQVATARAADAPAASKWLPRGAPHWCHRGAARLPCFALAGTHKKRGIFVLARRKPQRYRVVSRGSATPPGPKRHLLMCQIALKHCTRAGLATRNWDIAFRRDAPKQFPGFDRPGLGSSKGSPRTDGMRCVRQVPNQENGPHALVYQPQIAII
jgi:hypothetical protein